MTKSGLDEPESICRRQDKCCSSVDFCHSYDRKHCGKSRKCWLPAFSPFPTMFSKGFFLRIVKSRDREVKSKHIILTCKDPKKKPFHPLPDNKF